MTTPSIAERLQILIEYVYPAGAEPYSQARVAELASTSAHTITTQQVQGIVAGRTKHPSFDTVAGLAEFFKVPLDYFATTDDETWESYLRWIKLMRQRMDSTDMYAPRINRWRKIKEDRLRRRNEG